jgi:nitrogen regulatory protein PII
MGQVIKIEIIISTLEINQVVYILESLKLSGYTIIKNASGKGERGVVFDDLGSEFSNSYVMTICTDFQQVNYLIADILPILKILGGVCLITNVNQISFEDSSSNISLDLSHMQEVKKIEIIINTSHLEDAIKILDNLMVSGYTIIRDTSGKGNRGLSCADLDCLFSSSYLMTVCTNDKQLNNLETSITPLLKKVGGVCIITDAKWVNH